MICLDLIGRITQISHNDPTKDIMARIGKLGKNWRAEIHKTANGVVHRPTAVFPTKAEAIAWAAQIENEILSGKRGKIKAVTFGALLKQYAEIESPKKRGSKWEITRIGTICKAPVASIKLVDLTPSDFAKWRDNRLKEVSEASVRREWNILSAAINVAIKEWEWMSVNPLKAIKRPVSAPARERLFSDGEIEALCHTLGYDPLKKPQTTTAKVGAAMMFAIETGMRAGEIVALMWSDVVGSVATVKVGKTLAASRRVPLSSAAQKILANLPKDGDYCFGLKTQQIDALFRKARDKALIEGLHFHDTRATAVTRLAKKLDILDLAKMIGHRDLRMLQVYFRDSAEEIAKRLV